MGGAKLLPITSGMISGSQITFAVGQNETGVLNINGAVLTGKLTSSKGDIYDVVFTKQ
jgi:hypothetical protein